MGDTHQTPLGFDLLQAPETEPAEFTVVFDMPEDRLHVNIALDAEPLACFGEQIGFGLFPETPQAEADIQAAIALGIGTFGFEGTGVAVGGFIDPDLGLVTIFRFGMARGAVGQVLTGRAGELVPLGVVGEVLGAEQGLADQLGFAVFLLFPVEGVIFDIIAQLVLFEINIVLFTAISGISANVCG